MLQNITIKSRLIFVIGFLCLLSIAIGAVGLTSLSATNASVKTLYEDRVVALGQLDSVLGLIQQNQISLATGVHGDPKQFGATVDEVTARIARVSAIWKEYTATYLTPEEKILAAKFSESRAKFVEGGLQPALAAMKAGDAEKAVAAIRGPLSSLFKPVQADMQALLQLQLGVSKAEYAQSQERFESARVIAISEIAIGLLVGIAIGVWLISGITRSLAQALKIATSVAEGDLTQQVEIRSNDEIGQLLHALRAMNQKLTGIVGQVRIGTDTIATASSQIAAGNLDLSSRTEQQAASLEETASSMEELTATVKQNVENARQANQMAAAASTVAVEGGEIVTQVVTTMESIRASSKQIVDIISVIDGIAFQTNILALNAAVEAARAGEQGRGFAVVATEVRSLAQRSGAAAKEIKALIHTSVEKVDAGSELVGQAGKTMNEIVDRVQKVTGVMAEIMAASQEQSAGIEQINQAVSQMDEVTQQNAALVEEAAAAAQSLREQANNLAQEVSVFKLAGLARAAGLTASPPLSHIAPRAETARPRINAGPTRGKDLAAPKPVTTAAAGGDWEEF